MAFNRPQHFRRCIESLGSNNEASKTTAYFFLDGPRCDNDVQLVQEVRAIAREATCFARTLIVERERNLGLAQNVIDGVTRVLAEHGTAIVVEDDLFVSPAFLGYINRALVQYRATPSVYSVSGYSYPARIVPVPHDFPYDAFFIERHMCWGWGTWKDRWDTADWELLDYHTLRTSDSWRRSLEQVGIDLPGMLDEQKRGNLDSWAVRWSYAHFVNHGVCLVPVRSFVNNMGADGTGVHMASSRRYLHEKLNCRKDLSLPPHVYVDPEIGRAYMVSQRRSVPVRAFLKALKLTGLAGAPAVDRSPQSFEAGRDCCREN